MTIPSPAQCSAEYDAWCGERDPDHEDAADREDARRWDDYQADVAAGLIDNDTAGPRDYAPLTDEQVEERGLVHPFETLPSERNHLLAGLGR